MLSLPQITLIALTNKDYAGHKRALDLSCQEIEWGGVKLIWDEKITGIDEWNRKIIYELPNYVQTDYAMLIHADGYVINPECWRDEWLKYDYIGAPWPLPTDNYSYRDDGGEIQRVGNSVSLRSRKLMQLVASRPLEWFWEQKRRYGNCNEDGFISCHNRKWLEKEGCTFAPLEEAIYFSKEHTIEENKDIEKTFAFHQVDT